MLVVFVALALGIGGTAVSSEGGTPQALDPQIHATSTMELLTQTEGIDFNSYLRGVYLAVKKHWFTNMPASVKAGNRGVVSVEFHIQQDGTVPKESLKIKTSSGKSDLDNASLAGIREAAPFSKLPEGYSQPFIELRFTFYYNLEPAKP